MKFGELTTVEQTEQVYQSEIRKNQKYVGSIRLKKGLKVYELDIKKRWLKLAEFREVMIDANGRVRKQLVMQPNCVYTQALNLKNAEKQFKKMLLKK